MKAPQIKTPSRWVGIRNISDYSPFGVLLKERTVETANFRRGFQGQETDDEVKGEGNSVNYKFRIHDPRVGRFFAIDPLSAKYPWYTPYQFSGNKLIASIELEGLEEYWVIQWKNTEGKIVATSVGRIARRQDVQLSQYNGVGAAYITLDDPGTQAQRAKKSAELLFTKESAQNMVNTGNVKYFDNGLQGTEKAIKDKYDELGGAWKTDFDKRINSYNDAVGPHSRTATFDFPMKLNETFAQSSSELPTPSLDLQLLGQTMFFLPDAKIELHGYTNSDGSPEKNNQLSIDRAQSIKDYLTTKWGIEESRINVIGHGEDGLIMKTDNTEDKESSRRTEVRIINTGIEGQ